MSLFQEYVAQGVQTAFRVCSHNVRVSLEATAKTLERGEAQLDDGIWGLILEFFPM
jgi:hypothetical protein